MVELEKNGPILFVKPFPKPEALEIESCLDEQEVYVLERICPDYSITCLNKEGKNNKQHVTEFLNERVLFKQIVLMGKQCCDMLDFNYQEWGNYPSIWTDEVATQSYWITPALGTMMASPKKLKRFRGFVEEISENL